jgi:riboflavin synthase
MFTGIIEEVGVVARRSGAELAVLAEIVLEDLRIGDSVAIDGACMTVVALNDSNFVVQVSPESFSCTTLGQLRPGHAVNLERAMSANGRFGGHFMQGHVDGIGRIDSITTQGEFAVYRFWAPDDVARYLVPKGSVAIDGISLTVVSPENNTFSVAVIPETLSKTKLPAKTKGDPVNLEADLFGKHIYHYMKRGEKKGISLDFLARHGFDS